MFLFERRVTSLAGASLEGLWLSVLHSCIPRTVDDHADLCPQSETYLVNVSIIRTKVRASIVL